MCIRDSTRHGFSTRAPCAPLASALSYASDGDVVPPDRDTAFGWVSHFSRRSGFCGRKTRASSFSRRVYDIIAVSYTHLDVYKRQILSLVKFVTRACPLSLWDRYALGGPMRLERPPKTGTIFWRVMNYACLLYTSLHHLAAAQQNTAVLDPPGKAVTDFHRGVFHAGQQLLVVVQHAHCLLYTSRCV